MKAPTVVITMAGASRRFAEAGYRQPKFTILARGHSLFRWSIQSLAAFIRAGSPFVFVTQEAFAARSFIEAECDALGIRRPAVVELPGPTDGQATTALAAAPDVAAASPLAIYNIDTYVQPPALDPARWRGDGWIPCFPGLGDHWSFVRADPDGRATEVREKQRISPHATVGLYGFASFDLFAATYESCFRGGTGLVRGERYVAPMYNALIAGGHRVYIDAVRREDVHPLGTPEELEAFLHG